MLLRRNLSFAQRFRRSSSRKREAVRGNATFPIHGNISFSGEKSLPSTISLIYPQIKSVQFHSDPKWIKLLRNNNVFSFLFRSLKTLALSSARNSYPSRTMPASEPRKLFRSVLKLRRGRSLRSAGRNMIDADSENSERETPEMD